MLFDIHRLQWDETLCQLLQVPLALLPRPVENSGDLGVVASGVPHLEALAGLPIRGMAGDQQAALFGQGCFAPGQLKNTYGTGCFTLMNTGAAPVSSQNGLLTCVGWGLGGETTYVLEGSVFNAGSSSSGSGTSWGLIEKASDCDVLAASVPDNGGVYLVSAFTGLGAPHWDMYARGTVVGLTRGATRPTSAGPPWRASPTRPPTSSPPWSGTPGRGSPPSGGRGIDIRIVQYQADLLGVPVERPAVVETTAWGAACLAGLGAGLWSSPRRSPGPAGGRSIPRKPTAAGLMPNGNGPWNGPKPGRRQNHDRLGTLFALCKL